MHQSPKDFASYDETVGLSYIPEEKTAPSVWHEVAPGLWFPEVVTVVGPAPGLYSSRPPEGSKSTGYTVEAELRMQSTGIAYALNKVSLHALFVGDEVDGAALRKLSLGGLKTGVGGVGVESESPPPGHIAFYPLPMWTGHEGGSLDEKLANVAHIYARAVLSGRQPAKSVSEQLEAPVSTAGYWIRRAKDLGYIRVGSGQLIGKDGSPVVRKRRIGRESEQEAPDGPAS